MQKLKITPSSSILSGEVTISGAKNAALPVLFSSILSSSVCTYTNVPQLKDINTTCALLADLGAEVTFNSGKVCVYPNDIFNFCGKYDLVKTMRASILILGPLLAKYGQAKVSLPGGCAIGLRPVDLHIKGLQAMQAKIEVADGYIIASADKGLQGANIKMDMVSVTGTENLLMAATLARGTTVIENAAQEPEVVDLANCLIKMGAKISGAGTSRIEITGVDSLSGVEHNIMPDRIETGTYLVAGAITKGNIICRNSDPVILSSVLDKLKQMGASINYGADWIEIDARNRSLRAVDITTAPYPHFPTDMQAQFCVANIVAEGESKITETIFENRYMHIAELQRMGANVKISGRDCFISCANNLSGAEVMATDLRASASLVLAGLVANSVTIVDRIYHLDRGYFHIETNLNKLGANIKRIT